MESNPIAGKGKRDYLTWAQGIETEFCGRADLTDKRFYKVFYSKIRPAKAIVLFENPGGESDGTDKGASEYYENGEHDIVRYRLDSDYAVAGSLYDYLYRVIGAASPDDVAAVPMTNVIWHRSRRSGELRVPHRRALEIARPGLEAILERVSPEVIICTNGSFKLFKRGYLDSVSTGSEQLFTPNGRHQASVFSWGKATLRFNGKDIRYIAIGHPSTYARRRATWDQVVAHSRKVVADELDIDEAAVREDGQ